MVKPSDKIIMAYWANTAMLVVGRTANCIIYPIHAPCDYLCLLRDPSHVTQVVPKLSGPKQTKIQATPAQFQT